MPFDAGEAQGRLTLNEDWTAKLDAIQAKLNQTATTAQETGQRMSAGINQGSDAMSQFDRVATRMAERLALLYAFHGTIAFVKDIYESAAAVENLSHQLEFSTDRIQELQYGAQQTGVQFNLVGGAADTLTRKVAKGEGSVVDAFGQLGLEWDRLWAMNPEERFDTVARAVAGVDDKLRRSGLEVELFGTDKIDPLIKRMDELSDAAHRAGVVLDKEQIQALDNAEKSMRQTYATLRVLGSELLLGAQKWAAYWLAVGNEHATRSGVAAEIGGFDTGFEPGTGKLTSMDNLSPAEQQRQYQQQVTAQLSSMIAGAKSPGIAGGGGGFGPGGPTAAFGLSSDKAQQAAELASLAAAEKALTSEVRERMEMERQILEARRELLTVTKHINTEYEKERAALDKTREGAQFDQVLAEYNAKKSNAARSGVMPDGRTPVDVYNDPYNKMQRERDLLHQSADIPGVSKSEREMDIWNKYVDAVKDSTFVIVGRTTAEREAEKSIASFSNSLGRAAGSGNGKIGDANITDPRVKGYMASGYTQSEAIALTGGYGTGIGAPHRAAGGDIAAGVAYTINERGQETFVSSVPGSILPTGSTGSDGYGGGGVGSVNIPGLVFVTDPTALTMLQMLNDTATMRALKSGRKFGSR